MEGTVLLTMYSTNFIYGYVVSDRVKDYSDSEKGNLLLPPHGLLFPISRKGSFICTYQRHTTAFVMPVEKWLNQEIELSIMKDRSDDPLHHEQMP